jgi:hypothetical protein
MIDKPAKFQILDNQSLATFPLGRRLTGATGVPLGAKNPDGAWFWPLGPSLPAAEKPGR